MPPKKTAKKKGAPNFAIRCASPDVSEPEPLGSETGDVSDHREEGRHSLWTGARNIMMEYKLLRRLEVNDN